MSRSSISTRTWPARTWSPSLTRTRVTLPRILAERVLTVDACTVPVVTRMSGSSLLRTISVAADTDRELDVTSRDCEHADASSAAANARRLFETSGIIQSSCGAGEITRTDHIVVAGGEQVESCVEERGLRVKVLGDGGETLLVAIVNDARRRGSLRHCRFCHRDALGSGAHVLVRSDDLHRHFAARRLFSRTRLFHARLRLGHPRKFSAIEDVEAEDGADGAIAVAISERRTAGAPTGECIEAGEERAAGDLKLQPCVVVCETGRGNVAATFGRARQQIRKRPLVEASLRKLAANGRVGGGFASDRRVERGARDHHDAGSLDLLLAEGSSLHLRRESIGLDEHTLTE